MKSNAMRWAFAGLLGVAVAAGVVGLRRDNARLRTRIVEARRQGEPAAHRRAENRRGRELVARAEADAEDGARAIHEEVLRLRGEAEALAKRAEEQHAEMVRAAAAQAEALANNRAPTHGLTRLEHFQNVGQGTPGAAVQTLVFAALKGDDVMLPKLLALAPPARERAEALIARLPESERARWTPEKLGALLVTGLVTEVSAAQVVSETMTDAEHATVVIRLPGTRGEAKVPLSWGANGWQVLVDEKQIKGLEKQMAGAALPAGKK